MYVYRDTVHSRALENLIAKGTRLDVVGIMSRYQRQESGLCFPKSLGQVWSDQTHFSVVTMNSFPDGKEGVVFVLSLSTVQCQSCKGLELYVHYLTCFHGLDGDNIAFTFTQYILRIFIISRNLHKQGYWLTPE